MNRNINKFLLGTAAGIIVCKILSKNKKHLKSAAVNILSKTVDIKDEVSGFCSGVSEEALKNSRKNHITNIENTSEDE
ncbi:hypothetical protein CPAST_c07990 [Clostridium pasteurianum DSM 525 = ATCC 6013]|uniref:Uncharacterized protein n=1 Tax=Clostridium pasteurianum DSM 525 = ATCC 6013 TaxID=1262449 RepID=A0A0H3J0N1_CLOPA|nr:hypothetical protein [Clostridium pasteurianum]AJA46899.1 hypothetical protein CPAST_c07990 [Clostridium pasteurianum DSM 525 = ATCC 6013]AJA50887.1 hypothetical protein CLPA_c07990 [Clostridium pasteurianum DSM 525 = ATCC 6013]AOZ74283.1 hypothetical protein AQ983_03860 [Clostridium pasteurianum DSM 525 = ATCC 6013]AOZ78081.1 hypothetical protein AQ984_03865 [Clostridium pasteurianum]ELP58149.1 hypothetical protein F502_15645 [Clostridium pasteurianum DSM 525 = ATCC 6013]